MQFKLLIVLLFGTLLITSTFAGSSESSSQSGSDSGCSADSDSSSSGDCAGDSTSREDAGSFGKSLESDEDKCEELTDGADENDGECELIDGLTNITETITNEEYKLIWIEFVAQLKFKLSFSVDINIISSMILEFQAKNPAVWDVVAYKNITVTGFVLARYSKIVTYKQMEVVSSVYTMDDSDNCLLIEAFMNFSQGIPTLESAAIDFCDNELRPFLLNTTLSKRKRVIAISELITEFISRSYEYEAFWNLEISGVGTLRSFYVVAQTYQQSRYVKSVLSGSVETCELIVTLEEKYQQLISEGQLTIAQQFSLVIQECKAEFASETSFKGRLAIFIRILRTQGRLNHDILEHFYKISVGKVGSIFDLVSSAKQLLDFDLVQVTVPSMTVTPTKCTCTCN